MGPLCPRCGEEGDVLATARGQASCRVCGGGFVPAAQVLPALLADGISPANLKEIIARDGRKLCPCPTCHALLTTIPIHRELVHACTPCGSLWLDAGGLERLGGSSLPAPVHAQPAPVSTSFAAAPITFGAPSPAPPDAPLEIEMERQRPSTPMAPSPFAPIVVGQPLELAGPPSPPAPSPSSPSSPSSPHAPSLDVPSWKPQPIATGEPAAAAFRPSVGAFKESTPWARRGLMIALAVGGLALLYYIKTTAFEKGAVTPIGGGYEVLFWNQPVQKTQQSIGNYVVTRYLSPWGTNTLEAAFIPGAGGDPSALGKNGIPESIVGALYGRGVKLGVPFVGKNGLVSFDVEYVMENTGTTKNVGGNARIEFNEHDGFLVCAHSDSNLFPRSAKATAFLRSLRKSPEAPHAGKSGDAVKSLSGLAPDVD